MGSTTPRVTTVRDAADVLDAQTYPVTAAELAAQCGDYELEDAGGETLRTVIARTGVDRFEDATEARFAIYGVLAADAVGRVGYSDRDPDPMGVEGTDPVSF